MDREQAHALNDAFRRRHLPPGGATPQALLLDWDGAIPWTPDAATLRQMTEELADGLGRAVAGRSTYALILLDATELTLAAFGRALEGKVPWPEGGVLDRLTGAIDRTLAAAERLGDLRWSDGFKRLDALANLVATRRDAEAFCRRYLPPGVNSAHDLMADYGGKIAFVPDPDQLRGCFEAYTRHLTLATRVNSHPVRWSTDASEVALAYLRRAAQAGVTLPPAGALRRLHDLLRETLANAIGLFGAMPWYDGYKRVDLLAWMLEDHLQKNKGFKGWHVFRTGILKKMGIG